MSFGMTRPPSGSQPDRRDEQPESPHRYIDRSAADDRPDGAPGPADDDWIASLRDRDFIGSDPTQEQNRGPTWSSNDWVPSRSSDPEYAFDIHSTDYVAANSTGNDEWWRLLPREADNLDADASRSSVTETDDRGGAAPKLATPTAAVLESSRTRNGSRRKSVVIGAIAVLFLAVVVGLVGVIGRGTSDESNSRTESKEKTTATTAPGLTTTTIAPSAASSAPSGPQSPTSFIVRSTCRGRDCAVAVRNGPGKASYRSVGSLRTGEVVQIECSTHGELIEDSDTGRQSDIWYRQAATNNYVSALYVEGPRVPDCA